MECFAGGPPPTGYSAGMEGVVPIRKPWKDGRTVTSCMDEQGVRHSQVFDRTNAVVKMKVGR